MRDVGRHQTTQLACTANGLLVAEMGAAFSCCTPPENSLAEEAANTTAISSTLQSSSPRETARGRLLVFVNPHSGKGKSLQTFRKVVAPLLDSNNLNYDLVITTGRDHAKSVLISHEDLGSFNAILILSGDGLVFEAVNGILGRGDGFKILPTLPMSIIPSGSGNGLLCSVLHASGASLKPKKIHERAVEIATSGRAKSQNVAVFHVETDRGHCACFLSIGWGIMADIDIESEKWRKTLGSNRFTLGGIIRSLKLRTYRGKLSYRHYTSKERKQSEPYHIYDQNCCDRVAKREEKRKDTWPEYHVEEVPELHEPLDESWTVVDDEFISFYAVTLSHISSDGPYAPTAKLEDNRIHLTYILKKDVKNRMEIIKFLTAIENAKHLDLPFVKSVEVSAFRLEPQTGGSYVTVDGEVMDTTNIQVTSTTMHMSVFSAAK